MLKRTTSKQRSKKNISSKGDVSHPFLSSFIIFLIPLLLMDVLFFTFIKMDVEKNLIYIIINDIGIALIFSFLYLFFNKIGYVVVQILFFIYLVCYIAEMLIYKTYNVLISISSAISNIKSVTDNYMGELCKVIWHHFPLVFFSILMYIIFVIVSYEILFINVKKEKIKQNVSKNSIFGNLKNKIFGNTFAKKSNNKELQNNNISVMKNKKLADLNLKLFALVAGILLLFGSKFAIERTNDYSLDAMRYGLKTALYNDIFKLQMNLSILKDSENVDVKNEDYYKNYNVFNIDFDALNQSETNNDLKNINQYIASLTPSEKNEYTGLFKNKNLILICAEAYSHYVIDEKLTPTLYRLTNNGFRFNDFYVPSWGGSTTSGEFAFLTGLVATKAADTMRSTIGKNMSLTMPSALKREGYVTGAYHNGNYKYYDRHLTHRQNIGFDYYYATGNGLEEITEAWPTDLQMIEDTFKTYCDKAPFCMYYMTFSGHAFYNDSSSYKVTKSIEKVKARYGKKYPEQVMNYICYQLYLEDALARLLELLEEHNMMNDTVICMVADHFPYGLNSEAFTDGVNYLPYLYEMDGINEFEIDKNMPILWSGCLESEYKDMVKSIDTPTSTLDLLPTLLNLFGCSFDSRLLVGRDVLSNAEPFVVYNSGAFMTNKGKYSNRKLKFFSNDGENVDINYINICKEVAKNKILYSDFVPEQDYYEYLFTNENIPKDIKANMATGKITMPIEIKDKSSESLIQYFEECNSDFINKRSEIEKNRKEKDKMIYLTFDDGVSQYTNEIMDILKKYNVKATFFVCNTGKTKDINRMKEEGHTVALHTASHNYYYIYENENNYLKDLYEIQNAIYLETGEYVHILRFPGGSNNKISDEACFGIMNILKPLVRDIGFEYYDWNIDVGDGSDKVGVWEIFNNFKKGLSKKYNENIVLMHELYPTTVEALEDIIVYGISNGYKFDKITDDTIPIHK